MESAIRTSSKFDANAVKKNSVVSELTKGINSYLKRTKWNGYLENFIRSIQKWRLRLIAEKTRIVADKMIAVGSEPVCLPNSLDEKQIVSSTGAFRSRVPGQL